jgi:addiction module RelE/StbE family toxin
MKLLHTQQFVHDLQHECAYLRERNPAAARRLRDRVLTATQRLGKFPESGRAWRLPGARELIIPGCPYVVIYRIQEGVAVETLKLFHTSREFPDVH